MNHSCSRVRRNGARRVHETNRQRANIVSEQKFSCRVEGESGERVLWAFDTIRAVLWHNITRSTWMSTAWPSRNRVFNWFTKSSAWRSKISKWLIRSLEKNGRAIPRCNLWEECKSDFHDRFNILTSTCPHPTVHSVWCFIYHSNRDAHIKYPTAKETIKVLSEGFTYRLLWISISNSPVHSFPTFLVIFESGSQNRLEISSQNQHSKSLEETHLDVLRLCGYDLKTSSVN